jgi:MFS family permease
VSPVRRVRARITPERAAFAGIFMVTMLGLLSVGATLPVLPRYVTGPLDSGNVAVGIVTGAFAVTGLACRPLAGRFADTYGRKPTVLVGSIASAIAGALYFLPELLPVGVPGLVVARLFLGIGEGAVYTAGSAWVVDLAPIERRGRILGFYGLAIWGGLSLGPPIGELILRATSFEMVWAFATAAPLLGALIALRLPETFGPRREVDSDAEPITGEHTQTATTPESQTAGERAPLVAREALRPGTALSLATVGYAAVAAFIVLHLEDRGIGHGAEVFTAFAFTVVAMRLFGGWMPDRLGAARVASTAALVEAVGLAVIAAAQSIEVALVGAVAMGGAFALLFPSLALLVLADVPEGRRGSAMGTFTAFFDLGVGLGAPLVGAAAAIGGYGAAFWLATATALAAAVAALRARPRT